MSKLIMCRGIPGSGKSYWASQQDAVVVTKSDIREEYKFPCGFAGDDEWMIEALKKGFTVISADLNLTKKNESDLQKLAKKYNAAFEIKVFDTPLKTCIERDSQRDDYHRVGKKQIEQYYERFKLLFNNS
jgi:predicted kinase